MIPQNAGHHNGEQLAKCPLSGIPRTDPQIQNSLIIHENRKTHQEPGIFLFSTAHPASSLSWVCFVLRTSSLQKKDESGWLFCWLFGCRNCPINKLVWWRKLAAIGCIICKTVAASSFFANSFHWSLLSWLIWVTWWKQWMPSRNSSSHYPRSCTTYQRRT